MLSSRQTSLTPVRRDAWVEIDLSAVESNISTVRSWLKPSCQLMAVVKSDAYGHGASQIANVALASGASWLGVASVDEGCQLRLDGVKANILVLSPCPAWAMSHAIEQNLCMTVTSVWQVEELSKAALKLEKTASIQLKIDTGMHRLGIPPRQILPMLDLIENRKSLNLKGIFSHLARPGDEQATESQRNSFEQALAARLRQGKKTGLTHLASSLAARRFPDTHYDLVRVGLYLYGLESGSISEDLTPAMSVRARINHLQEIATGESAGYDWTWTSERPTRLGSIPIGYGDGVDRRLSNRLNGLLWGRQVKQVGLISMDQMLFDLTDVPGASEGDVITLIGSEPAAIAAPGRRQSLHLATWAVMLDTITYELACRLRVRLPRVYTRQFPNKLPNRSGQA